MGIAPWEGGCIHYGIVETANVEPLQPLATHYYTTQSLSSYI